MYSRKLLPSLLIALLIGLVVKFSGPTLLVVAGVYALHGVVLHFVRLVRRRVASRHA